MKIQLRITTVVDTFAFGSGTRSSWSEEIAVTWAVPIVGQAHHSIGSPHDEPNTPPAGVRHSAVDRRWLHLRRLRVVEVLEADRRRRHRKTLPVDETSPCSRTATPARSR